MSESSERPMEPESATRDWLGLARSASAAAADGIESDPEYLRELLVFGVDGSAYAIDVVLIREIVRLRSLTRLPRSPDWMLGIIALRGEVVEVVDLRRLLGVESREPSRASRIIVLGGDPERVTGVLVDSVREVLRVDETAILPADGLETSAVVSMCRDGDEFVSILDVDRILGLEDE